MKQSKEHPDRMRRMGMLIPLKSMHSICLVFFHNLNAVNVQAGQILRFANNQCANYAKAAASVLR